MKAKFYSSISRRSYYTYNDAPERLLHNPLDIQQLLSVSKFRQTVGPNNGIHFRFRLFLHLGVRGHGKDKDDHGVSCLLNPA